MYTVWEGRKTPFTHWMRVDMDMILGDFSLSFPWHLLEHFDVLALRPSYGWKGLWLSGAGCVFRLAPHVDRIWLRIPDLQTPNNYCQHFASRTGWLGSSDEGALGKAVVSHDRLTWIFLPNTILQDLLANWHIDYRGDDDLKSLIYTPDLFSDKEVLRMHQSQIKPDWGSVNQSHGVQRLSYRCERERVMMFWVPDEHRVCVESTVDDSTVPWEYSQYVWREVPFGKVYWNTMNNPMLSTMSLTRDDGSTVTVQHLKPIIFHLLTWKKSDKIAKGFRRQPLAENEMISDRGGVWVINKYK